jgi:hypothetical protein
MSLDQSTGVVSDPLTDAEYADLEGLETTISKGLDTFVEVGSALAEIRDRKLYRQYHGTFAAYCEKQWEIGKSQAYRLIEAAEVVTELETSPDGDTPLPTSEAQARALKDVEPSKRADVMKKASEDGPPTAPKIKAAGAEIDPAMKLRQEQEAERARARAEKAAVDAAKSAERKQAQADAAVIAAAQAEREATDLSAHATAENSKVRSALKALLELDPVTTGPYCTDPERRLRRLAAVEQWCADHRGALESEGASLHVIHGG